MSKSVFVGFLIIFVIGVVLVLSLTKIYFPTQINKLIDTQDKEVRLSGYKYISPLLECEDSESIGQTEYHPSINKMNSIIKEYEKTNKISYASIYYRDLSNGPWFGINETDLFAPASLLKVPIMLAFYKQAESGSDILTKKIKFSGELDSLNEFYAGSKKLEKGQTYTVDELINRMIIYSDNDALALLSTVMTDQPVNKVMNDLGIKLSKGDDSSDYVTVRQYSSLLRVLFNASYLNADYSEKALENLGNIEFKQGLNKGVPTNILIAHKFGERELTDKTKQLHDCGIIYYPGHPYLLCVMTRGTDYNNLSDFIGKISNTIYSQINNKYGKH